MSQDRSGWIIGGMFLAFFTVLYLVSAYDDIYDRRVAYLFDPETDDVFMIEMAPSLNRYKKWEVFIPFKSLHYVDPDGAEYIGKLHNVIAEFKADMELLTNDIDAWSEKQDKEMEQLISNDSYDAFSLEFWDIEYYPQPIQNATSYMSNTLTNILKSHDIEEKDILVVDAVIAKSKISDNRETDKPAMIRIVRKALLFKDKAAYVLSEQGL
ncbi:hypothetical protein JYT78_00320 [bacterium AH-315-I20]|nr:hypothetical protein [Mariprofundus ferrooxydans]MBN4060491.1 hypothetical protein [bacterium AH-315-I20]